MDLQQRLAEVLPSGAAVAPVPSQYVTDWSGRSGRADVLVRARSVADVSAALIACRAAGAAVVPVGGNTGLVGGTVTTLATPTVVLSLADMTDCQVDPVTGTALVQAGVTIAQLRHAAEAVGWTYGVDLASRDSATIGGTIATNAGGIHVCAYGTTRRQVLGLQAVLADGSVLDDLRGLPKDNTGYPLGELMCGSEGTLAVITAARVRLQPAPGRRLVLVFPVAVLSDCVRWGQRLGTTFRLLSCEAVDRASWRGAAADLADRDPLTNGGSGFVTLVELDIGGSTSDAALELLADDLQALPEVVVGSDENERASLWRLRENQAEWWSRIAAESTGAVLHKFDVTLPLADMDSATAALAEVLAGSTGVRRWGLFGHVYEGSLHIQLTADDTADLDEVVLRLVSECGGSLSAEHGVGRDKAPWLALRRSATEIATMRAIKIALDPTGMLNPGVILDP